MISASCLNYAAGIDELMKADGFFLVYFIPGADDDVTRVATACVNYCDNKDSHSQRLFRKLVSVAYNKPPRTPVLQLYVVAYIIY